MPRSPRPPAGGIVTHVLNRANARLPMFEHDDDYELFERTLEQARARTPMRILSYCVMPNHWHLVLWPRGDSDLPEFMRWLTVAHTQRWHAAHGTAGMGHIYQGRYKSFPCERDEHLLALCRYVERNAKRAGLVKRAEDWRWGSLARWKHGTTKDRALLSPWPLRRLPGWAEYVNTPQSGRRKGVRNRFPR